MHPDVLAILDGALADLGRPAFSAAGPVAIPADSFGFVQLMMHMEQRGLAVPDAVIEQLDRTTDVIGYLETLATP